MNNSFCCQREKRVFVRRPFEGLPSAARHDDSGSAVARREPSNFESHSSVVDCQYGKSTSRCTFFSQATRRCTGAPKRKTQLDCAKAPDASNLLGPGVARAGNERSCSCAASSRSHKYGTGLKMERARIAASLDILIAGPATRPRSAYGSVCYQLATCSLIV